MTPEQISATAITLDLIRKWPPKAEGWNRPGERTLADMLQSSCPTCSHEHMRDDGSAFVKCPVCIFDPVTDPKLQGCWITVPG